MALPVKAVSKMCEEPSQDVTQARISIPQSPWDNTNSNLAAFLGWK